GQPLDETLTMREPVNKYPCGFARDLLGKLHRRLYGPNDRGRNNFRADGSPAFFTPTLRLRIWSVKLVLELSEGFSCFIRRWTAGGIFCHHALDQAVKRMWNLGVHRPSRRDRRLDMLPEHGLGLF